MAALFSLLVAALPSAAPDLSLLSPAERQVFDSVAAEEFCSCDSQLTLAGCLKTRPDCRVAEHLSRLLLLTTKAGLGQSDILGYLADRVSGPFCSAQKSLDPGPGVSQGAAAAPVTVVEFLDFRCGHCREAAPVVHQTLQRYGKKVRYVYMPFPLQDHPAGLLAAQAALAADAQGKFQAMHDALFALQDRDFSSEVILEAGKLAGLDLGRLQRDLDKKTFEGRVLASKQAALALGIDGTPTFFVNGRRYEFDPTVYTLAARLDMELDRGKGKCQ